MCQGAAMSEEDGGACEEVEFEEEVELFGDGEVEEDEGDGEDEADEALGEDVQGHDGGEGEAGEERRVFVAVGRRAYRFRDNPP